MDTKGASKPVEYEIRMLGRTRNMLRQGEVPVAGELHDAVLESFAVHTRNLIEFFFGTPKDRKDDVRAEHFFGDPTRWREIAGDKPPDFAEAQKRANKQISHLTYARVGLTQEEKGWLIADLGRKLLDLGVKFVAAADEDRMGPKLLELRHSWGLEGKDASKVGVDADGKLEFRSTT